MKTLLIIALVLMSLVSFPSWGLTMDDLVQRNGIYFEKFTIEPFVGEVSGTESGKFLNGQKVGQWIYYHSNGHPREITYYQKGKKYGVSEWYNEKGQLEGKGNYKDGKEDGLWEINEGQFTGKGKYKDGRRDGLWLRYWDNGQLMDKGELRNGKQNGYWQSYNDDGTVLIAKTGTFRDGLKVTD